jgi:UDP-glucose 4-epimerase|tara:strand:+ start:788 stop:1816 length:1029 start_codon:yes stop_codon:yes gene_type:complete
MKILITGIAGLMGSRLTDWILENTNHKVVGIDDLSGGYESNISSQAKFYRFDLSKDTPYGSWVRGLGVPFTLQDIFEKEKPDIVYHFAAYAAECLSPFIRRYNYQNNVVATANIINECIRTEVDRLVFTSSMAVYGENKPPFSEDLTPAPKDPYGVAKLACEMDIQIAGEQHELDWCILRPHNVYGANQNIWDRYRNVLGIWMYQHMNGDPLTIFGDGNQRRAFSYIDDSLEPMWKAGTDKRASKQIINLGSEVAITIKEASHALSKIMGGADVVHLEPRHEVHQAFSTHEKSELLLDFKDKTSYWDGLSTMWEWAQQQPKRKRKNMEYEIDKEMYSYWRAV